MWSFFLFVVMFFSLIVSSVFVISRSFMIEDSFNGLTMVVIEKSTLYAKKMKIQAAIATVQKLLKIALPPHMWISCFIISFTFLNVGWMSLKVSWFFRKLMWSYGLNEILNESLIGTSSSIGVISRDHLTNFSRGLAMKLSFSSVLHVDIMRISLTLKLPLQNGIWIFGSRLIPM